jgi:hypothetical protein
MNRLDQIKKAHKEFNLIWRGDDIPCGPDCEICFLIAMCEEKQILSDHNSVLLEQSAIEESRAKDGLEFEEWFWKNPMADLRDAWMSARGHK